MMAAAVFTVVLLSNQPAEAGGNFFKGIKDKMIKAFAGCYKKSQVERSKCTQHEINALEFYNKELEQKVRLHELGLKYKNEVKNFEEEVTSTIKEMNRCQRIANEYREKNVKCLEAATEYLLNCRLDKKKFKDGCDEKKMDAELKKIDANVIKVQGDLDECIDKCDEINDKNEANLRKAGKQGKKFGVKKLESLIEEINSITQTCKSKC